MTSGLSKPGEAALAYATELGWAVFPLHTPTTPSGSATPTGCSCGRAECSDAHKWGKHPRVRNGVKDATTEEETIRRWWTMWPDANIAVATGSPSKMIVIDVDGPEGERAIAAHLTAVETPRAQTGGGHHYVFALPIGVEIRNSVRSILPQTDVRGDGGYIVVAPSQHGTGRTYRWDAATRPRRCAPKHVPASLLALLMGAAPPPFDTASADGAETWSQGSRNDRLFCYVSSRVGRGLREHEVRQIAQSENDRRCRPPLRAAEVDAIVDSALATDLRNHGPRPDPMEGAAHKAYKAHNADLSAPSTHVRSAVSPPWPDPIAGAALHGLAGDYVRLIAPQSEADPVAVLVQLLATVGAMMGWSCPDFVDT